MEKVLYFISCNEYAVKIGFTDDIHKRLKQLQTGNPYELKLLHLIADITPQLEGFVHEFFKPVHIKNEWYDYKGVYEIIDEMKQGYRMQDMILSYNPLLFKAFIYKQKNRRLPWWYNKFKELKEEEEYRNTDGSLTPEEYSKMILDKWDKEHTSAF